MLNYLYKLIIYLNLLFHNYKITFTHLLLFVPNRNKFFYKYNSLHFHVIFINYHIKSILTLLHITLY